MKFWIPPGTRVEVAFNTVSVHFHRPEDADKFAEWLFWLDKAKDGTEMTLTRPPEHKA